MIFATSDNAKAIPFTKVILDAGHGGHDLGGTFGLTYEKHLALDVVRGVDTYLKSQGIATKLTRARDEFISLQRRARIANAESGAIFVSIHFNHARSRKAAGIETFYHTKNKNSLKLAHMIQSASLYKPRANNREIKRRAGETPATTVAHQSLPEGDTPAERVGLTRNPDEGAPRGL